MENNKYLLNTEKVLFTSLEEEGVLYAIEENKYISLNTTYTSIIQYVSEGLAYNEIVTKLIVEYEVEQELCEAQLKPILADLIVKGYIINEITV